MCKKIQQSLMAHASFPRTWPSGVGVALAVLALALLTVSPARAQGNGQYVFSGGWGGGQPDAGQPGGSGLLAAGLAAAAGPDDTIYAIGGTLPNGTVTDTVEAYQQ